MRFLDHILARHGHVNLEQIPVPPTAKQTAKAVFKAALKLGRLLFRLQSSRN